MGHSLESVTLRLILNKRRPSHDAKSKRKQPRLELTNAKRTLQDQVFVSIEEHGELHQDG